MTKVNTKTDFWDSKRGSTMVGVVCLALAYTTASLAIDTGSWQQYGMTIVFLGVAINRLVHAIRNK